MRGIAPECTRGATHLSGEDETRERRGVDPCEFVQDRQGGDHPVAVAHLGSRTGVSVGTDTRVG